MADDNLMSQEEIERLLGQAASSSPAAGETPAAAASQADDASQWMLAQSDIERLFHQEKSAEAADTAAVKTVPPAKTAEAKAASSGESTMAPGDVEFLLSQAERALESINSADLGSPADARAFSLEEFSGAPASTENTTIDLIRDVELDLKIELGRTQMYLDDVLRLRKGSVVPLDKLAGDPVDIYVNGRLIARGEVLVLNDNFCVRVAELIAGVQQSAAG